MMIEDKTILLEKMNKQRFLPITEDTFTLYQEYSSAIDPHDPDELSYLLFYEGEYYYRIGDFNKALGYLTRCLQAPKKSALKYLEALSYNIIGLIYSYLGQETIAINNLLQCKALCEDLQNERILAICNINLGLIYNQLENYDIALNYYDYALEHISASDSEFYDLKVYAKAYKGIIYCKTKNAGQALTLYQQINTLQSDQECLFYRACILNLYIQLNDYLKDETFFKDSLSQLLNLIESPLDFLELSEFYFDVSTYLIEKQMQPEAFSLLHYMEPYINHSPLVFLQYNYQRQWISYARTFLGRIEYLEACSRLINLRPAFLEEQRYAKLYSFEYIERLRQTKNDSEMYREKSRLDQMTGLLNKYTIQFLIEEDLSGRQPGTQSAMVLIDLDHFKQINDTLGHLAGDNFICQTAAIIQNYFKDNALCGRVGGDEFLLYISEVTDISFVVLQTEILRQEIYRQASVKNSMITTQASIGIAFSSEYCYNFEQLFSAADDALYRAKTSGRNKVIVAE